MIDISNEYNFIVIYKQWYDDLNRVVHSVLQQPPVPYCSRATSSSAAQKWSKSKLGPDYRAVFTPDKQITTSVRTELFSCKFNSSGRSHNTDYFTGAAKILHEAPEKGAWSGAD